MRKKKWHSKRMVFHNDDWVVIRDAARIIRSVLDKPYLGLPACIGHMAEEIKSTYGGEHDVSSMSETDFTNSGVDLENADNVDESGPAGSKGEELERR